MRTPRRSRPSARPSTTSPRTSSPEGSSGTAALGRLIDALPANKLEPVLTHTSWASDRAASYERLEFLGDSVLELAIARELYERFPEASEGRLAKIRAHVVSRHSCAGVARELGLGERLVARAKDVPEPELQRLAKSRNVLAAVLEAAIAAVYLEHGFTAVEQAVVAAFAERIDYARSSHVDNKTELQEALARSGRQVQYLVLTIEGPAHDRRFVCAAVIDGEQLGSGRGSTKKAAEQEAARQALEKLGIVPDAL